jgi:hypothetical protein
MIRFKQYLEEAFDKPYEFKHEVGEFEHLYHFSDGKTNYRAFVSKHGMGKHGSTHEVGFATVRPSKRRPGETISNFGATGEQGHRAPRVFSTVRHILRHHADANPGAEHYTFSSEKSDDSDVHNRWHDSSRSKLYKTMTHRAGGKTVDSSHDNVAHHFIPAHVFRSKK